MEPFKDNMSPALVACIARHLETHLGDFDRAAFESSILKDLQRLELKARAQLIADHVHRVLPASQKARGRILRAMLHPGKSSGIGGQSDGQGLRGWGIYPLTMVVGQHGLGDFRGSLLLLKEMTSRFSSEFDVRYFLIADQERTLQIMGRWVNDPDHHVRRLVSEGTRPRLPWGMQLPKLMADPSPMLPLLEALRDDEHEYVRRSVANHLNDIAKDHPDLIANLAKQWMKDADKSREKLVRHACRTLIKQGHPVALEAFGVGPPQLKLERLSLETTTVRLGGALKFTTDLHSTVTKSQLLVIDYLMHFKKANGERVGKVFKWKQMSLGAGETVSLERSHPIRPITTRRYYEGQQGLSLRINGQDFGLVEFYLTLPDESPA
jgi:3-methyladenine DNA glycosylase AlkC